MKSKKIIPVLMACATLLTVAAPIVGSANTEPTLVPTTKTSSVTALNDTPGDFVLNSPWKAGDTSISGVFKSDANKVRWTLYDKDGNNIGNGLTGLHYNNGTYDKWSIDLSDYADKSIQKIVLEGTYGAPESTVGYTGTFYMQQIPTIPDDSPGDFVLNSPWKAGDTSISGVFKSDANKVRWTLYDKDGNNIGNGLTGLHYNNGTYDKWSIDLSDYADKSIQKIVLEGTYGAPESTVGYTGTFYVR